nr:hypothetical protein SHINE37_41684 [Rhizobiaceae bacterium]
MNCGSLEAAILAIRPPATQSSAGGWRGLAHPAGRVTPPRGARDGRDDTPPRHRESPRNLAESQVIRAMTSFAPDPGPPWTGGKAGKRNKI